MYFPGIVWGVSLELTCQAYNGRVCSTVYIQIYIHIKGASTFFSVVLGSANWIQLAMTSWESNAAYSLPDYAINLIDIFKIHE